MPSPIPYSNPVNHTPLALLGAFTKKMMLRVPKTLMPITLMTARLMPNHCFILGAIAAPGMVTMRMKPRIPEGSEIFNCWVMSVVLALIRLEFPASKKTNAVRYLTTFTFVLWSEVSVVLIFVKPCVQRRERGGWRGRRG